MDSYPNLETSVRRFFESNRSSSDGLNAEEGELYEGLSGVSADLPCQFSNTASSVTVAYSAPASALASVATVKEQPQVLDSMFTGFMFGESMQSNSSVRDWTGNTETELLGDKYSDAYKEAYGEAGALTSHGWAQCDAVEPEPVYSPYTPPLDAYVPACEESTIGDTSSPYSPVGTDLTYVELKQLREMVDTNEHLRHAATKQFLSKKAEEPVKRKKKAMVFDEKPPLKAAPTFFEGLAVTALATYFVLVCLGAVKIDSIPLIGPVLASGKSAPLSADEMKKTSQAQALAQIEKARDLSKHGDKDGAFGAIDESLRLSPTSEAYAERARMAAALGYGNTAVDDYNRAIELNRNPALILERGLLHSSAKRWKLASADFSAVIKSGGVKDMFRVYAFRARANAESGRYLEAVRDYKQAIALAPSADLPELKGYKNELSRFVARTHRKSRTLIVHHNR